MDIGYHRCETTAVSYFFPDQTMRVEYDRTRKFPRENYLRVPTRWYIDRMILRLAREGRIMI